MCRRSRVAPTMMFYLKIASSIVKAYVTVFVYSIRKRKKNYGNSDHLVRGSLQERRLRSCCPWCCVVSAMLLSLNGRCRSWKASTPVFSDSFGKKGEDGKGGEEGNSSKCHLVIQAEFVPENKRTVGSGRTRTRRSRRAAIK